MAFESSPIMFHRLGNAATLSTNSERPQWHNLKHIETLRSKALTELEGYRVLILILWFDAAVMCKDLTRIFNIISLQIQLLWRLLSFYYHLREATSYGSNPHNTQHDYDRLTSADECNSILYCASTSQGSTIFEYSNEPWSGDVVARKIKQTII
jgi:hypothetical protein